MKPPLHRPGGGIQLFFSSPLVALQKEFSSPVLRWTEGPVPPDSDEQSPADPIGRTILRSVERNRWAPFRHVPPASAAVIGRNVQESPTLRARLIGIPTLGAIGRVIRVRINFPTTTRAGSFRGHVSLPPNSPLASAVEPQCESPVCARCVWLAVLVRRDRMENPGARQGAFDSSNRDRLIFFELHRDDGLSVIIHMRLRRNRI